MQTLLVAVDGSPPALKGLRRGCEIAKGLGLSVTLAYVAPPTLVPPGVSAETIEAIDAAMADQAKAVFATAKEVAHESGCTAGEVTLQGAPAEAICDYAQADNVWGIVVGAKGHSALSRVLLGSVADRLVHLSPKPVVVVR